MSYNPSKSTREIDYEGESDLDDYFVLTDNYNKISECQYLFIEDFIFEDSNIIKIKLENGDFIEFLKPYHELHDKLIENFQNETFYICTGNDGHNKEYEYYCKVCKKNLCRHCFYNDKHHYNQRNFVDFNQIIQSYLIKGNAIQTKLQELPLLEEFHIFNTVFETFKKNNNIENEKIYNNYSFFPIIESFGELLKNKY